MEWKLLAFLGVQKEMLSLNAIKPYADSAQCVDYMSHTAIKKPLAKEVFVLSGIVDDVRTYFQSTADYFFIPSLSLEAAKIN